MLAQFGVVDGQADARVTSTYSRKPAVRLTARRADGSGAISQRLRSQPARTAAR